MRLTYSNPTHKQARDLITLFVESSTARTAAALAGVNRNTATQFFLCCREVIAQQQEKKAPVLFDGEAEVNESYFGGVRKGKCGRDAPGKTPFFDLLKRDGRVYAQIVPDAKQRTLLPIITDRVMPDSIVYTDSLRSYDTLDVSEFKHYRIDHNKLFADRYYHTNGK